MGKELKAQKRIRLLEADPELAAAMAPGREQEARERLVAPVEAISRGSWKPRPTEPDAHLGYLMISGVLSRTVSVNGSHSAELLDAGNLLRPWQGDPSTVSTISWQALEETRIAVLDPGVAKSIAEHPVLVAALVERATSRTRNLAVHWAIGNTVGLEKRVLLLFRHLSERWGRITPEGVEISLPITHQLVSDLVGARRPSVTTALSALARSGTLVRGSDGAWLLRH
ncbi:MAG: helix-turn-helix domain-containing protein [Solirubrobacterales bacterium]